MEEEAPPKHSVAELAGKFKNTAPTPCPTGHEGGKPVRRRPPRTLTLPNRTQGEDEQKPGVTSPLSAKTRRNSALIEKLQANLTLSPNFLPSPKSPGLKLLPPSFTPTSPCGPAVAVTAVTPIPTVTPTSPVSSATPPPQNEEEAPTSFETPATATEGSILNKGKPVRRRPPRTLTLPNRTQGEDEQKPGVTSPLSAKTKRNSALIEKLQANLTLSPNFLPSPKSPGLKLLPPSFTPTSPCGPAVAVTMVTPIPTVTPTSPVSSPTPPPQSEEEAPTSFETPATATEGSILMSINKGRARLSIRRRPPSRRHRTSSGGGEETAGAAGEETAGATGEETAGAAGEETAGAAGEETAGAAAEETAGAAREEEDPTLSPPNSPEAKAAEGGQAERDREVSRQEAREEGTEAEGGSGDQTEAKTEPGAMESEERPLPTNSLAPRDEEEGERKKEGEEEGERKKEEEAQPAKEEGSEDGAKHEDTGSVGEKEGGRASSESDCHSVKPVGAGGGGGGGGEEKREGEKDRETAEGSERERTRARNTDG